MPALRLTFPELPKYWPRRLEGRGRPHSIMTPFGRICFLGSYLGASWSPFGCITNSPRSNHVLLCEDRGQVPGNLDHLSSQLSTNLLQNLRSRS